MIKDRAEFANSGAAAQFGEPPAQPHEQKAPIAEELRRLTFKGVTDELQHPAAQEHRGQYLPPANVDEEQRRQQERKSNNGYPRCMAQAVDIVLVA